MARGADAKIALLKSVPLFAGLSKTALNSIARITEVVDLPEGWELIREGERGREFFLLIADGEAEVRRQGRKVNTMKPGDFFGEISLITGRPTTASVTLTEPAQVLVIRRTEFRRLLRENPSVQLKVLEALADRVLN